MSKKVCCLLIMDGFGVPADESRSAITKDNTKNIQDLASKYPATTLKASEIAVGLPEGQMGTSEVGHLTMGIGRVKYQSLVEINEAIKDGSFYQNKVLLKAMENAKLPGRSLHLLGIPTDGGIHSRIEHLLAILKMSAMNDVKNVYIHYFTDGRDVPPTSALEYLEKINDAIKEYGTGKVASIVGRFYALDRDNNWDRVEKAYNLMVRGEGKQFEDPAKAIQAAYNDGETDEFITPIVIVDENGPIGVIKSGDSVISYNYRTDREKQLAHIFDKNSELEYVDKDLDTYFVTMTEYDSTFTHCNVAFPNKKMENILAEVLADRGYSQMRIAETEKFNHVTFFFNDGNPVPYKNEERVLINSVKLKSYADNPAMSAKEVADATINALDNDKTDVYMVNLANCDMVGHSGDLEAAKKAVQIVDEQAQRIVDKVLEKDGVVLLTADHGNADCMVLEEGTPCTSHTTALVPFILIGKEFDKSTTLKRGASLADIAPTILKILGETKPAQMTGESLF